MKEEGKRNKRHIHIPDKSRNYKMICKPVKDVLKYYELGLVGPSSSIEFFLLDLNTDVNFEINLLLADGEALSMFVGDTVPLFSAEPFSEVVNDEAVGSTKSFCEITRKSSNATERGFEFFWDELTFGSDEGTLVKFPPLEVGISIPSAIAAKGIRLVDNFGGLLERFGNDKFPTL
jgi:hypothetical protein